LDALLAAFSPVTGEKTAEQLVSHVLDAVGVFSAGRMADDDRTLLALGIA
jgi:hypothetical protein